jgi:hypothetical protein
MDEENNQQDSSVIDVIEEQGRPRVFSYKFTTPDGDSKIVAVISMSSTDAKMALLSQLPEGSTLMRVGVIADFILQA